MIRELQDKANAVTSQRYSRVPAHAIPKAKFSDRTANGLTRAIIAWLDLHGHFATRVNVSGRQLPGLTYVDVVGRVRSFPGRWIRSSTVRGVADIICSINGRHVSIEIKMARDKQSAHQKKVEQEIIQDGGTYIVVKSFDEFLAWYQNFCLSFGFSGGGCGDRSSFRSRSGSESPSPLEVKSTGKT